MSTDDRLTVHRAPLPYPGQTLDVEWVREADWDAHWALVFTGVSCRQELRRLASYTEAKNTATAMAERICATAAVPA